MVFEGEVIDNILRVNCLGSIYGASMEDSDVLMARVIEYLMADPKVVGIVLAESREYEYDLSQTKMLIEIAKAITSIVRDKRLVSIKNFPLGWDQTPSRFSWLQNLVTVQLREDPIGAYVNLIREIRHARTKSEKSFQKDFFDAYLSILAQIQEVLDGCMLIQKTQPFLTGYHVGDRSLYREFFHPSVRPNFMFTKYMAQPPVGEALERYHIGDIEVEIFKIPGKTRYFYHVVPPEFRLNEDEYVLLDGARRILEERRPKEFEMKEQEKMREIFYNIGLELLRDLAEETGKAITKEQIDKLASILTRYTAGLGIIEILLADEKIQDVYINSPLGTVPVYIFHGNYEECETNLIPTRVDGERWATRFKLISGRPLDEANPVLDTETAAPGGRARIACIYPNLAPDGMGLALRRHRDRPWTFPLFLNAKYFDPLFAGLMSFISDYGRSYLVAGGRSSGKTSLLGSCMLEILPRYRTITVEDSVTGDCQLIFERNGKIEKSTVGKLIDGLIEKYGCEYDFDREVLRENNENIRVFSISKDGKVNLSKVRSFIRHKTGKDIYEVITRTGKKIKVTGDHSIFTLGKGGDIEPVKVKELRIDDYIVTPRLLPIENRNKENIDIFDYADKIERGYFSGDGIRKFLNDNWEEIKKRIKSKSKRNFWKRKGIVPAYFIKDFLKKYDFDDNIYYKSSHNSKSIPRNIRLTDELLRFFGLWLADGYYDKKSVIISVVDEKSRECVRKIAEMFGINVKMHSDGFSLILNSSTLRYLMMILGFCGDAYTKKMPHWVYSLNKCKIACILCGLFTGDGYLSKNEVAISLVSQELVKDVQTLLLAFEIISRVNRRKNYDKTYSCRISALSSIKKFEKIGFLQQKRMEKLSEMCDKKSTHDSTDTIPLSKDFKRLIQENSDNFNYWDYIGMDYNIGRQKLLTLATEIREADIASKLLMLAQSDIFFDSIREIRKMENEGLYVYDFSVPEYENFICENILAHNTLELPVEQMQKLGYNIERLKSRSVITRVETELPAEEALRTALRLGDSCLIIGEVRSSLRGCEEVVIVENGETKRVPIKSLEGKDISNIKVPTLNENLEISLTKLTNFVKHPKREKLIEIITKTGRKVTVTPDHSVFTHTNFTVHPIETNKLKKGDKIIIPASMPCGYNDNDYLNLTKILPEFRLENAEEYIRKAISKLGWKKATEVCRLPTNDIYLYLRRNQKTRIPIKLFKNLMKESGIEYSTENLKIKNVTSNTLPAKFPMDKDFCRFLGYFISEGHISQSNIVITNSNNKIIEDIISISRKLFDIEPAIREIRGFGNSKQITITNSPLSKLLAKLGCGKTSKNKKVPSIIYGLSKEKICAFLKGLYSGDGCFSSGKSSGNCVRYFTTSKKLAEDVLYLLLTLNIVARIMKKPVRKQKNGKKDLYIVEFKQRNFVKTFLEKVGFVQKNPEIVENSFAHSNENSVIFDVNELEKHIKLPRKYRHLRRTKCCSKNYLNKIVNELNGKCSKQLFTFANGKFYLDEIKEIKEINLKEGEFVFDLSVNPTENFIGGFGGIVLHNTESKALYEAMRIGALANVVAGTIHGESAYGVFDRVVNDLGVPPTSFKATDLIVICNRLRSADGLHTFRRVVEVTEVRKHWKLDPQEEGGFVNLMEYSSKQDALKPTDTLLNGESFILNEISQRVREWAGNWNAVWENILLRGKICQSIVEIANATGNPELLEAETRVKANEMFHLLSERSRTETGSIDSERIYREWLEWFKNYAKGG